MPQIRVTPWRYQSELLRVRREFYQQVPEGVADERRNACDQVAAWRVRGGVPHAVESTAAMTDAALNDQPEVSTLSVRGAYASAFGRFVTGLTDVEQTKRHKISMFDVSKGIGLPESFVELRHRITHEELPSLSELRRAIEDALLWLWNDYWKDLPPDNRATESIEVVDARAKHLTAKALGLIENMP